MKSYEYRVTGRQSDGGTMTDEGPILATLVSVLKRDGYTPFLAERRLVSDWEDVTDQVSRILQSAALR